MKTSKLLIVLLVVVILISCGDSTTYSNPELLEKGEVLAQGDLEYLSGLAIPMTYQAYAFIPVEGQFALVVYTTVALSAFSTDVILTTPDNFYFSRDSFGNMVVIPLIEQIPINTLIPNGDTIPVGTEAKPKDIPLKEAERIMRDGLGESAEKLWGERHGESLTEDHVIETPNGEKVVVTQHAINHALQQSGELALKCFANKAVNGTLDLNTLTNNDDRSGLFHGLKNFAGTLLNGNKLIDFCGEGDWLYARISVCESLNGQAIKVIKTIIRFTNNSKGRANLMRFVQNENKGVNFNACN